MRSNVECIRATTIFCRSHFDVMTRSTISSYRFGVADVKMLHKLVEIDQQKPTRKYITRVIRFYFLWSQLKTDKTDISQSKGIWNLSISISFGTKIRRKCTKIAETTERNGTSLTKFTPLSFYISINMKNQSFRFVRNAEMTHKKRQEKTENESNVNRDVLSAQEAKKDREKSKMFRK